MAGNTFILSAVVHLGPYQTPKGYLNFKAPHDGLSLIYSKHRVRQILQVKKEPKELMDYGQGNLMIIPAVDIDFFRTYFERLEI